MIKQLYFTFFGLFGLLLSLSAQTKVSGKILDANSKQPLPFVSVSIKGKPYGTITNNDGIFEVRVDDVSQGDTLMVSLIGYKSYLVDISYATEHYLQVLLSPAPVMLKTVVVESKDSDPNVILAKALEHIHKNFQLEPYIYRGFLRETWSQNDKTVSLVEAVVDVMDDGYKAQRKNTVRIREKVNLKSVRASRNYMNPTFKNIGELYNTLSSALRWNQLKYPHPEVLGSVRTKDCTLDDAVYLDEDSLWVISFVTDSKSNNLFQRKDIFYINQQNFAIKKHESREYSREGKYRNQPWALPDSAFLYKAKDVHTVYEFEEYNGKMYLKYFYEQGAADIYHKRSKSISFEVEGTVTFVVDEIQTTIPKMRFPDTIDHDKSLNLQATPYDPAFWNQENAKLNLLPLTRKEQKDLEWELSLEQQFAEIGTSKNMKDVKR